MRFLLATVPCVALSACGGGGVQAVTPSSASSPGASARATAVRFTISVPPRAATATANARRPQYVSSATQSVIVTLTSVNGTPFTGTATTPASIATNLTTSDPACTMTGGTLTCVASGPAVAGNDIYTVATYDAQQSSTSPSLPAGSVLSRAALSLNVVADQVTSPTVPLVLGGVVASMVVAFATDPHISGSQAAGYSIVGNRPYAFTVTAVDASGETIIGPGAPTLTAQSGSSAFAISTSGANTFSAQAKSFSKTPVQITITPSQGAAVDVAFATVQELWISNLGSDSVTAFIAGTNVPLASDTINALGVPFGLAFDAGGNLWIADGFGPAQLVAFVPGTNTPIAADTITSGLSVPGGIAFDSSGNIWAVNEGTSTAAAYVPGTNSPIAADTITNAVVAPYGITFDRNGNVWIANQNATVTAYAPGTNTPISADTIGSGLDDPAALRFDASGNLWVSNVGSNNVLAFVPGTTTPIVADTITTGLMTPVGLAFDGAGNIWVASLNNDTVYAFVPGTNTPIAADTITGPGINGPFALAFSP